MTHISADVFGGQKSLIKPVTRQKTCNCNVLLGSSFFHQSSSRMIHISADVRRIILNASCMTISGGRTKQLDITAGFLLCHWLYEQFSPFHRCGTFSFLSLSPSIVIHDSRSGFSSLVPTWQTGNAGWNAHKSSLQAGLITPFALQKGRSTQAYGNSLNINV